jgi:hypothetical protein
VVTAFPSGDCPTQVFGPAYEFAAEQWAEMPAMKLAKSRFFFAIGAYVLVISPEVAGDLREGRVV